MVKNSENMASIRAQNLKIWTDRNGVPAKEKSYFSQLTTGAASFGEKAARRIEDDYNMGAGYLDTPISGNKEDTKTIENINPHLNYIKKYDETGGSMGTGLILKDQPGQITNLVVTDEWINKNVPSHTGKNNLSVVTGFGDSMKGMFNPGDPLLVDTGINNCDHDGVYFFRIGEEGYVKLLQRIPKVGIKVISKNPDYETWTITDDMDFEVFAKVLIVWKSENF